MSVHPLRRFIITAFLLFIGWRLLYDLLLLPDGRIDYFMSITGVQLASYILIFLGWEIETSGRLIAQAGSRAVEILNGCNGLQVLGLFSGFIFAYPGNNLKRIYVMLFGMLILYFSNVIRIIFFVFVNAQYPDYWDISHSIITHLFTYPIILLIWYWWIVINEEDVYLSLKMSS
ncbi:MAG: hypothetical protein CMG60_04530 [Candidatus Marinimicrobia bacterium]|nr:hypothetical protein [Candidatus Neomarinimicrobiota bacterium]